MIIKKSIIYVVIGIMFGFMSGCATTNSNKGGEPAECWSAGPGDWSFSPTAPACQKYYSTHKTW